MTRQHRQAGTIYRSNEIFATEQDIVDGTFMYMLSNVEKGSMPSRRVHFSIIRTKNLIRYDRRPHSITMEIIAERGFITYTPCSFVHHFEKNSPRNRWRNLRRNDTSLSSGKRSEKI
jgi:hypothetical protein